MTLRASPLRGSSKMPAHLVEQGFSSDLRVHHTKNPQPDSGGFVGLWGGVQATGLIINALR